MTKCIYCKIDKTAVEMAKRGTNGIRSYCKPCDGKRPRSNEFILRKRLKTKLRRAYYNRRLRDSVELSDIARVIRQDACGSDRRYKRQNDLTIDFIITELNKGCSYCKASPSELRMTLDRIDNNIGHTMNNVKPACIRCNYMRRDMPFIAWLAIVPVLESVRLAGLFHNWTGAWRGGKHGG